MHLLAALLGNSALVLKEYQVKQEGEEYVHLVARKAGIISWLLALLGIDSTTIFSVFKDHIEFEEGSLSGNIKTVLPLRSIGVSTCGFMKPILLMVIGILLFLAAVIGGIIGKSFGIFLLFAILAGIFFLFYFLNKSVLISVISHSGYTASICFKRSVIEGVKVDYEQAQQVIQIIKKLMLDEASK